MAIKMGNFSGSGEKEKNEQTEIVQDKYTGEQFEIERHSDFITILPNIINTYLFLLYLFEKVIYCYLPDDVI